MITVKTIEEAREALAKIREEHTTIGFVPTMGALHDGHLSLVERSRELSDFTVMSIFVNRIQFNDKKDYEKYPRDYGRDAAMAEKAGCGMLFLPDDSIMFKNQRTYVYPEHLDQYLCGAARPGHFRGVCTIVSKLFNIIQPDFAVFGQKDIQQCAIISKMTDDLNIPVQIIIAPTVREENGLAMSSRNILLSDDEKTRALSIIEALRIAEREIAAGEHCTKNICESVQAMIQDHGKPEKTDYVSIVDFETLHPVDTIRGRCILAVAAFFGTTRLIDNMIIEDDGETISCVF